MHHNSIFPDVLSVYALQGLVDAAPLDSKVDDLLELDEADLKKMLSPDTIDEVMLGQHQYLLAYAHANTLLHNIWHCHEMMPDLTARVQ